MNTLITGIREGIGFIVSVSTTEEVFLVEPHRTELLAVATEAMNNNIPVTLTIEDEDFIVDIQEMEN